LNILVLLSVFNMPLFTSDQLSPCREVCLIREREENAISDHFARHSADHSGSQPVYQSDERWVNTALAAFLPNTYTKARKTELGKKL
jgi:hypothetical protein